MKKLLAIVTIILAFSLCTNAQDTESFNSYNEMVASAKAEVEEISVTDFHKMYSKALSVGGPDFTLIDVRTEAEYSEGFIPGAFLVQRGTLESRLEKDEVWEAFNHAKPQKSDSIILYCGSGRRSALAAKTLKMLGYTNVKSLEGGWRGWSEKYPNLKNK